MKKITVVVIANLLPLLVFLSLACSPKPDTNPTPAPTLTPEQRLALAKVGGMGAVALIDARIRAAESAGNTEKVRILRIIRGAVDEYNTQIAPVTSFSFEDRAQLRRAGAKALESAERLIQSDVVQLKDPALKADLLDAISIARVVIQGVQAIIPTD